MLLYSLLTEILFIPLATKIFDAPFLAYRLFTIAEYFFITIFIYYSIISKNAKRVIVVVSAAFLVYALYELIVSQSNSFDSIPSGVESILIIAFCIYYLFEKIREPNSLFLYSTADFWIIVSFIIYFAGTFFLFIYSQNNFSDLGFRKTYELLIGCFNLLKNVLLFIAFMIKSEKKDFSMPLSRKTSF